MKVAIGSDHAGFLLKEHFAGVLAEWGHEVIDFGTDSEATVDYPYYCASVARAVVRGEAERGIVIGGSGQGEQLAANKVRGARAALCNDLFTARLSRAHNNANVLSMGGRIVAFGLADEILKLWLETEFEGGRHAAAPRAARPDRGRGAHNMTDAHWPVERDSELFSILDRELERQNTTLQLIASENFTSPAVLEATGSVLTNKYSEGYPGKRYYGGNEVIDEVEDLARERAKALFSADHANVQPHAGANANMAVYLALLDPGDTVLGMKLDQGGHLTHGSPVNASGKLYRFVAYGVTESDERIDFDEVRDVALRERPKMIVAGATAYPRIIDPARSARSPTRSALFLFDAAHVAGLIAGGQHPNPIEHGADIMTFTTHKTLRGRAAAASCRRPRWPTRSTSRSSPACRAGRSTT